MAAERTQRRSWPREGNCRVPFWVYTDPALYQLEQERIFGGASWSYVGLAAEIPKSGDFKRTFVGEKPVVLVRDQEGLPNVLVDRCAHRGVQFCRRDFGNTRTFTCPYHQWTYDLRGRLVGVPLRRGLRQQGGMPRDFRLEEHALATLRVAERHGVVFASFDPRIGSLEDYLGAAMLAWFDRVFDGRPLRILGYMRQRIRSNWKLMFENIKDPYHASLLHVFLVTFGLFRADQPSAVKMDPTGRHAVLVSRRGEQKASAGTEEMQSFRADYTLQDPRLLMPVKEFPGEATVVMQTIWPNLIVQQQSNTLATRQLVPRGPQAFDLVWTFFGYADDSEEMTRIRLRQANLMGPAGLVSVDDSEMMEFSQSGVGPYPDDGATVLELGGRECRDEEHMITETAIRGFYRYYREIMGL
ncbi:MAG TPA: aromatic ring-hydroxylating dioxygenase subunit alpha [Candidatus Limnocylindria bacterium]|nr:aromatic ring-hydroxylating dioxygenase subunit alpha [Candidatus Limnocylindria bacterium]